MKRKIHKALAKRIMISGKGKMSKRRAGQDHFNSREPGKVTRNKRRDVAFAGEYRRSIKTMI